MRQICTGNISDVTRFSKDEKHWQNRGEVKVETAFKGVTYQASPLFEYNKST
jgi:hypothetical protein